MTYYTKTEIRLLINKNLSKDTLNNWLKKISEWTLYNFNVAVPTHGNAYRKGQPVKRVVYDETDIEYLKQLYQLRIVDNLSLAYAIHKVFLLPKDFEKWQKGEWNKEEELKKVMEKVEKGN